MAIRKQQIINAINAMPEEEFNDIEVLLERIIMLEKVEKAEMNITEGKTYTTEQAKQYEAKWLY